ncbi:hypothetical protein AAVH_29613, partial [Aphelenchoides avenae]
YALMQCSLQCSLSAYYLVLNVIPPQQRVLVMPIYPYIADFLFLSGPVCLLVTSKCVRNAYISFYLRAGRVKPAVDPVSI